MPIEGYLLHVLGIALAARSAQPARQKFVRDHEAESHYA